MIDYWGVCEVKMVGNVNLHFQKQKLHLMKTAINHLIYYLDQSPTIFRELLFSKLIVLLKILLSEQYFFVLLGNGDAEHAALHCHRIDEHILIYWKCNKYSKWIFFRATKTEICRTVRFLTDTLSHPMCILTGLLRRALECVIMCVFTQHG